MLECIQPETSLCFCYTRWEKPCFRPSIRQRSLSAPLASVVYPVIFKYSVYVCVCVRACALSCVWLFAAPWPVACQAPLSMEFSRQGYWSRLPCSSPRNLPDPVIEPTSLASPALAGRFFTSCTILIQPKYSTNSSNSITHFLHMFTFWIVGFVSFSSHFPHVCVCVFFSELFDSNWETSHTITLKYLSVYFLRLNTVSFIATLQK